MQSPWPGQDVLVNGQVTNVGADGLFRVFLTDREVVRITGAKRVEREREPDGWCWVHFWNAV